jgi:glutamate dehydrogenase
VEGANIFNTPEARDELFKNARVVIVKDSSANKCGVITSSYEVQASMMLSQQEFLTIKDEMVADVVEKLKKHAQVEADLLFRAYSLFPGDLPHFSERISNAINRMTDAIAERLAPVNPGEELFEELRPLMKG